MSNTNIIRSDGISRADKEILVYATSIKGTDDLKSVKKILDNLSGIVNWNVDLEDWEKVLRIESIGVPSSVVMDIFKQNGFSINELV